MTAGADTPRIRVLLVEDNPGDAKLILEMLQGLPSESFELELVDRLAPALDRLSRAGVDVVLLDLDLPDSSGLATFQHAQRHAPNEPILVLGQEDEYLALEALRAGAQDYLVKGRLEGDRLARLIRYALERKRAEWTLRWLTQAVNQSPAAIFITDLTGRIEYVNSKFTQITGYTPAEAIGQTPRLLQSGLTPPETYAALWGTLLAGRTWRGEIRNCRKNGELYWDAVVISPIRNARGQIDHYLAIQEDITARRDAESALRALFTNMPDGFALCRMVFEGERPVDFVYLEVNPAFERLTGLTDVVGKRVTAVIPRIRETNPELFEIYGRIARSGDPAEFETYLQPLGIHLRVSAYCPSPAHFVALFSDITDRVRTEGALRASEQRLRTLFETVNLIVLVLDADAKVDYVNPYFLGLAGYAPHEVFGQDWFLFLPERDRAALRGTFEELIGRESHPHYRNPIRTKGGEELMIAWHNTVLRSPEGRAIGTLSVGEDITERLALEDRLRQAQKMEAVGQLAGGVAHDFNNVLTSIFGYADLLAGELPPGPAHEDVGEIRKAATRAASLTRQLLAFSRRQVLQPTVLSLNEVVANLEKMLRRLIGEDVVLRTALDPGLGSVLADSGQIEQVIVNLALNGRDAMPTGGQLTIETANVELSDDYAEAHRPVVPGPYVQLAVSDNGVGMTEEVRARLFEPFFTTKEKGKGTGLGLATVYGIVKQSGGYIWAYSEPGHGATFKVYLPRVDAPAVAIRAPVADMSPATGTETLLLAEDDDLLRPLVRSILEKLGYRVLDAATAEAALAVVRESAEPIHLLVTDVVMPGESGRQLARRLAEVRPDTRVLYISGYTDEAIIHHGMLEPGLHYLQKPFTPAALARRVREVLDGHA